MTEVPPKRLRPSSKLVSHDIRLDCEPGEPGAEKLEATVHCERRTCRMNLNECRYCERFARIDVHEAGYVMLCRSTDEPLDDGDADR